MYKLIVIDDELQIREGIQNKINWSANEFELVGTAENGLEVLELARNVRPDVVKMPIMMNDYLYSANNFYLAFLCGLNSFENYTVFLNGLEQICTYTERSMGLKLSAGIVIHAKVKTFYFLTANL